MFFAPSKPVKKANIYLDQGPINVQEPYPNHDQDVKSWPGTSMSSKVPNEDLKDLDVLDILKINLESPNSDQDFTQKPYQNHYEDRNSRLVNYYITQSPKSGLKWNKCLAPSKWIQKTKIWIRGLPEFKNHVQIMIRTLNHNYKPPALFKVLN